MRNAFVQALRERAQQDKRIFVLTGDLGFTVFEPFIQQFPNRFLNVGVAEANMVGVASGLAKSGKIPVIYSIATFMTMRAFEQIRNDIAITGENVKIIGVGGGLSYGHAGPTHHSIEDIALMRSLPSVNIIVPSDPASAVWATKTALGKRGPFYIRLGKKGEPSVHDRTAKFNLGKAVLVKRGTDVTMIASGPIVHNALKAAQLLKRRGISSSVLEIHTLKPLDKKAIIEAIKQTHSVCTIEEHSIYGGLGSAVSEVIAESGISTHFLRIGIPDIFCTQIGDHQYLQHIHSLSAEKIAQQILKQIQ